jgi:Transglutaminase-like superfamily
MKASALLSWVLLLISASLHAQLADFHGIDFSKADSVARLYPKHSLRDLKSLADKLTIPLSTEVEKFRAIYVWVCANIENDYKLFMMVKHQREKLLDRPKEITEWNKKTAKQVFDKLLQHQKTICTGYAYLIRELATHAGLSCVIVDGYGRTAQANIGGQGIANHSWNVVQLNNKWYVCDATWSSGAIQLGRFVKKFDDFYFLAEPSLFVRNHYPLDTAWILLRDKPTLREFLNRPLVYSSLYRYKITQLFPETFSVSVNKGKAVSFQFKKDSDEDIEKIELNVDGINTPIATPLIKDPKGLYCIDYTFASKGTHVVHVLLNFSYAFSYTVRVK